MPLIAGMTPSANSRFSSSSNVVTSNGPISDFAKVKLQKTYVRVPTIVDPVIDASPVADTLPVRENAGVIDPLFRTTETSRLPMASICTPDGENFEMGGAV